MKKYIQLRNNKIVSISDKPNKVKKLQQKQVDITKTNLNKLTGGFYEGWHKNGKVVIKKSQRLLELEKKQKHKQIINKIKSGKYTHKELAALLEAVI